MVKYEITNLKIRLDRSIMGNVGVSYAKAMSLISDKDVKVNGKRVKENLTVYEGDVVEVFTNIERDISVVYEDDNIIVVFKDFGISTYDLLEKLISTRSELHAVHRLDTNTQGLIMFAKNTSAYESLLDCFERRELVKEYLAVVVGVPLRRADKMIAYLKKDSDEGMVQIFDMPRQGRELIYTEYETREVFKGYALLNITLHTGKTHQIRAHMAYIGYPILGDGKYGNAEANKEFKLKRQELIAYKISFKEPEGSLAYLNGKVFEIPNAEEKLASIKLIKSL
ncbi:MAG: RluA family pseudouridine synthase [Clostridia bacterium]